MTKWDYSRQTNDNFLRPNHRRPRLRHSPRTDALAILAVAVLVVVLVYLLEWVT